MRNLPAAIIEVLRDAPAPLRIAEIAAALKVQHTDELRSAVGALARDQRIERHHHPDGLHYALSPAVLAAAPPPRGQRERAKLVEIDRIVTIIEAHAGSITVTALNAALAGGIPKWRVKRLLRVLAADGVLIQAGSRRHSQVWFPGKTPALQAAAVQASAIDGRTPREPINKPLRVVRNPKPLLGAPRSKVVPAASDAVLAALEASLRAAERALAAYLNQLATRRSA